jgi:hypothetical protein
VTTLVEFVNELLLRAGRSPHKQLPDRLAALQLVM